jgi:hypothetical protein
MRNIVQTLETAGFKIVPKQPTEEMISSAHGTSRLQLDEEVADFALWEKKRREEFATVYMAMITGAPAPPPGLVEPAENLLEVCKDLVNAIDLIMKRDDLAGDLKVWLVQKTQQARRAIAKVEAAV